MKDVIKILFIAFTSIALSIGLSGCEKGPETNPDDTDILTNVGGLSKRLFTLGGEATFSATGAQMTDVMIMSGKATYECEITSVSANSFKFRVPQTLVNGEYTFTIKRDDKTQTLGKWTISVTDFEPSVQDDGKSSLRGMVYCDNKGVDGVLVTDGVNFTKTADGGKYYLNSDKRYGVVYIVLPSGYDVETRSAQPQFWQAVNDDPTTREQHHFKLVRNDNTNHTILVATDIHLSNRNLYPRDLVQFSSGFVNEVREKYTGVNNVYCFNLGDFAWDIHWYQYWNGEALQNALSQVSGLPCQFWSTMGNHDNDGHAGWETKDGALLYNSEEYWAKDLKASLPFRTVVGPTHISMNIGGVHYMLIDDINYENTYESGAAGDEDKEETSTDVKMGERDYHAGFRPDVIEWVRKDLSYVDKSTPVVVGMHIPLGTYWGGVNGEFSTNYAQRNEFISLFEEFSEVEFITGHTHVNRMRPLYKEHNASATYGTNMYEHNIGAVCGIWWKTSQATGATGSAESSTIGSLNLCSDGAPAGYMVYNVTGKNRTWKYKPYGVNKTSVADGKQFKTYDMNSVKEWLNGPDAKPMLNALASDSGVENTSTQGPSRLKRESKYYGIEEEDNVVWINVWGYERGSYAGYGECSLKVTENGVTTDITNTVNDGKNTSNPISGYSDPLAAAAYDVYTYKCTGKLSQSSISRDYNPHLFKYVAGSRNSTLTIVYTDRFGNQYRETMTRPKKFWDGTNPLYTLD